MRRNAPETCVRRPRVMSRARRDVRRAVLAGQRATGPRWAAMATATATLLARSLTQSLARSMAAVMAAACASSAAVSPISARWAASCARKARTFRSIARNLYARTFRRTPEHHLDDAEREWVATAGPDGGGAYVEALRECTAELAGRGRVAIELRYAESLSREAIGRRMGISADGVKSLLRRAREALRACVERRLRS